MNNKNDFIKLTKQLEEFKFNCENKLLNHINKYLEINKEIKDEINKKKKMKMKKLHMKYPIEKKNGNLKEILKILLRE